MKKGEGRMKKPFQLDMRDILDLRLGLPEAEMREAAMIAVDSIAP
jgi:hypothetical protein